MLYLLLILPQPSDEFLNQTTAHPIDAGFTRSNQYSVLSTLENTFELGK